MNKVTELPDFVCDRKSSDAHRDSFQRSSRYRPATIESTQGHSPRSGSPNRHSPGTGLTDAIWKGTASAVPLLVS